MGGRGSSSGRGGAGGGGGMKAENDAQFQYAKLYGQSIGAKTVEFTDSSGKTKKVETGRTSGGTYKATYSQKVADYAKMSQGQLESELKKLQAISNENYQGFTRAAASRSGSLAKKMASADVEISAIKKALWIVKQKSK